MRLSNKRMTPEPVNLRDFAQRYTAAWCSQNAASVAAFYSPNGSLSVNDSAPAAGREAITGVAQGFMTVFPRYGRAHGRPRCSGDRTRYRWTLGTNAGPGGTGKRVCISGFEEWQIGADGLIAESKGYFDAAAYKKQLR
jgi:hypothetical protein